MEEVAHTKTSLPWTRRAEVPAKEETTVISLTYGQKERGGMALNFFLRNWDIRSRLEKPLAFPG